MSSPNDNVQLRDGLDAIYKLRTKDVSTLSDGSLQVIRHYSTPYPIDYGVGGSYQITSVSSFMAAGLAAGAPIYAFRWTSSTLLAIVKKVRVTAFTGTGFASGIGYFTMVRATAWTVADTGGVIDTLGADNGNMRTSMPATALSEIRHSSTAALTAGTRTLDAQITDNFCFNAPTTASAAMANRQVLFDKSGANDHPLVLAQNEGFIVTASVPATGTWVFTVTPEWDEVPVTNY